MNRDYWGTVYEYIKLKKNRFDEELAGNSSDNDEAILLYFPPREAGFVMIFLLRVMTRNESQVIRGSCGTSCFRICTEEGLCDERGGS